MTRRGNIVSYDDALRARSARERYVPSSADAVGHIVDLSDRLNQGFVSPFRSGGVSAGSARPSATAAGRSSGAAGYARRQVPGNRVESSSAASLRPGASAPLRRAVGSARSSSRMPLAPGQSSRDDGRFAPSDSAYRANNFSAGRKRFDATPSWYDQGFDPAFYGDGSRGESQRRDRAAGRSGGISLPAVPAPSVSRRGSSAARTAPSWYDGSADDQVFWDEESAAGEASGVGRSAVYTPDDYEEDVRRDEEASGRSKREERKRAKRKEQADRKFDRQFGSDEPATGAGGPRAAVYKGEMGTKQRKATRMQRSGANESARTLSSSASKEHAGVGVVRGLRNVLLGVGLLVALGVFLYEPAQQYYQALREHDRLEAEYASVEARHGRLQTDLADLQTDSGLEARAHQQLGWVKKGEQTANVRGLDVDITENSLLQANIDPADIELPQTWYSPILDPLFGVE
ncbi:septum formation initiator family protein [Adlercreutzia aquisgranensis]|uniref:septum formation initiator family protein n=1 Tax=Adlercreutzia aquisgranensis TaxID=2941323 RepID=UPI00203DADE9|nr:septum formation initiator family protein [Adlercreutzia aquisgranensis]